jgi:hypothetical protein
MNSAKTMKTKNTEIADDNKQVMVESRGQKFVTCPHCWTDQRTDRDFCYRCGSAFIYLDEARRNYA